MSVADIAFPNLGIYLRNIPKSFSIFGFDIALYGVLIGIGVLTGILLVSTWAKRTNQNPDLFWDFFPYVLISSIIGGRLYYVFFTWERYKDDFLSVFNLRQGGMAIYGGVIAGFITLFLYAGWKKENPLLMADTGVLGLIIGQVIGRWGNFTNREAFGEYTNNLFAMRLPILAVRMGDISESVREHITAETDYIQVHPTFLYESMWNLGLLIILLFYWKHKQFTGEVTLLYLAGYGLGRIWIEQIRSDQLLWPGTNFPVSQMLAIFLVISAGFCDVIVRLNLKIRTRKGKMI